MRLVPSSEYEQPELYLLALLHNLTCNTYGVRHGPIEELAIMKACMQFHRRTSTKQSHAVQALANSVAWPATSERVSLSRKLMGSNGMCY